MAGTFQYYEDFENNFQIKEFSELICIKKE